MPIGFNNASEEFLLTSMNCKRFSKGSKDMSPWSRDKCEDPFPDSIWNDAGQNSSRNNTSNANSSNNALNNNNSSSSSSNNSNNNNNNQQAYSNSYNHYASMTGAIGAQGSFQRPEDSWSPQRSDDPLQKFRACMQNGELNKLTESFHLSQPSGSSQSANNSRRAGSLSSDESTESIEIPLPTTTWSAIVQKNPRPVKHKKAKPTKTFTITLPACCPAPRIKLTCACCNEETFVKIKEEMKPRLIPVSTSQLGFCRFCQTNGDPPEIYQGHSLRSDDGKVTCPVLREYNCPICNNGGGDFAHTIKYCPMARKAKPL